VIPNPRDLPFPSGTFVCVVVDGCCCGCCSVVTALGNLFDVVVVTVAAAVAAVVVVASSLLPPLMANVVALFPSLRIVVAVDDEVAPADVAPPLVATVAAAALSLCRAPATPLVAFEVRVTLRILEVARPLLVGGEVAMEVLAAADVAAELRMTSMD